MGKKIQCIGKYVMSGQTLGKGSFARVELAVHDVTKCKVAVKIIDTRKITEDYVRNNLYREARILSQLRHPNIIRYFESLKAGNLYCLVSEYAAGGDMFSYIKAFKDNRLPEHISRIFLRQLVSAVHYMHQRGVVHRDLKVENIILDERKKNVKICDFGLSNLYDDDNLLSTHCGSPEYAAPELFEDNKFYGPEVDVWSLGVILYVVVVSRLPFSSPYHDHNRNKRLLVQINKGLGAKHEKEMSHLSTDCKSLLRQMIEPNPSIRLPLSEVPLQPWITKCGKSPFSYYLPPQRDPSLRSHLLIADSSDQSNHEESFDDTTSISSSNWSLDTLINDLIGVQSTTAVHPELVLEAEVTQELSELVEMPQLDVERAVHESRTSELSAMFAMLLERRKQQTGFYSYDHTMRACPDTEFEVLLKARAQDRWKIVRNNIKSSARTFKQRVRDKARARSIDVDNTVIVVDNSLATSSEHSRNQPIKSNDIRVTSLPPDNVIEMDEDPNNLPLGATAATLENSIAAVSFDAMDPARPNTLSLPNNNNKISKKSGGGKRKKARTKINPVGVIVAPKKQLFPQRKNPFDEPSSPVAVPRQRRTGVTRSSFRSSNAPLISTTAAPFSLPSDLNTLRYQVSCRLLKENLMEDARCLLSDELDFRSAPHADPELDDLLDSSGTPDSESMHRVNLQRIIPCYTRAEVHYDSDDEEDDSCRIDDAKLSNSCNSQPFTKCTQSDITVLPHSNGAPVNHITPPKAPLPSRRRRAFSGCPKSIDSKTVEDCFSSDSNTRFCYEEMVS